MTYNSEYGKKNYEKNREKLLARAKERYWANKNNSPLIPLYHRKWTDEDLEIAVISSHCFTEVSRKLGVTSRASISKRIQVLQLDISHFDTHKYQRKGKYGVGYKAKLNILTRERGHKCESCGLTQWLGKTIPLTIHHIYGKKFGDTDKNLQLLCPNCHTFTDNYCGKMKNYIPPQDAIQILEI